MGVLIPAEVAMKGEEAIKEYLLLVAKQEHANSEFNRIQNIRCKKLESLFNMLASTHNICVDKRSKNVTAVFHQFDRVHSTQKLDYEFTAIMHGLSEDIMNLTGHMVDCQRDYQSLQKKKEALA